MKDQPIRIGINKVAVELAMFKRARELVARGVPVGLCRSMTNNQRMIYWVEGCLTGQTVSQSWHAFRIWDSGAWTKTEFLRFYEIIMEPEEFHTLLEETDGV